MKIILVYVAALWMLHDLGSWSLPAFGIYITQDVLMALVIALMLQPWVVQQLDG